jgi:hypothetical protein
MIAETETITETKTREKPRLRLGFLGRGREPQDGGARGVWRQSSGGSGVRSCSSGALVGGAGRLRWRGGARLRAACFAGAEARRGQHGKGAEGAGAARKARAWQGRNGHGHSKARRLGDTASTGGGGLKSEPRDPNVRLKRVRSAFRVMTGRGGRMTRRGGGSVRS